MENVVIRNYRRHDQSAVEEITYRTGYQDEGLTGRDFFDDKRLLILMFIDYYPRHEPEQFFVAVDTSTDEVVAFIGGTLDAASQEKDFRRKITWRLTLRMFLVTSWRYPRTFRHCLAMSGMREGMPDEEKMAGTQTEYPAHLHINFLPGYQGQGIGTRLMKHFETHLVEQDAPGVHLATSDYKRKALPFCEKLGFTAIHRSVVLRHPEFDDLRLLTFARRLGETSCPQ